MNEYPEQKRAPATRCQAWKLVASATKCAGAVSRLVLSLYPDWIKKKHICFEVLEHTPVFNEQQMKTFSFRLLGNICFPVVLFVYLSLQIENRNCFFSLAFKTFQFFVSKAIIREKPVMGFPFFVSLPDDARPPEQPGNHEEDPLYVKHIELQTMRCFI